MDAEHAGLVLARLRENWSHVDVQPSMAAVWIEHLRDVPFDLGMAAAEACIAEMPGNTFPVVSDVRNRARARARRAPDQGELAVPPPTVEQRESFLANIRKLRADLHARPAPPDVSRRTVEAEARALVARKPDTGASPPPFCDIDDHSRCASGPVRQPKESST